MHIMHGEGSTSGEFGPPGKTSGSRDQKGDAMKRPFEMPQDSGRLRLATNRLDTLPADLDARYVCDSCGEEIVVPIDLTEGRHQDYVEDCPVCCNPMVLHVDIADDGEPFIRSEHE